MPGTPAPGPEALAELAPTGALRAGINFGNPVVAQPGPEGGAPQGVGPSLARALAARLGVPIEYRIYETAGRMAEAAPRGEWDVAFLAADPARAAHIEFTAPYLRIEGTYLVRASEAPGGCGEVDRPGVRVAVVEGAAYALFLARHLRHAKLVAFASAREALEAFLAGRADAAAGIRQPLLAAAAAHPGLRVLDDAFMSIGQAAGVPRGRPHAAAYLAAFIAAAAPGA